MEHNAQILKRFINQNPYIEAIVLSDKECVEICSAYLNDNSQLKENSISLMFVAAITQNNDNLTKICHTKTNCLTLIYEEHIVYIENWTHMILSIYCSPQANIAELKSTAKELKDIFAKFNATIEKYQQINK